MLEGIAGFKEIERFARTNGAFHATALQVALQYRSGGSHDFVGPVMARRAGVCAPLVQNFWQMNDGLCLLGHAQDQVVVLRYFQLLVKATESAHQRGAKPHHVHDVGVAAQVLGREGGAVKVLQHGFAIRRDEHFV